MKRIIFIICGMFFLFSGSRALAAGSITTAFGAGFPILEDNLAPGQIVEREFTVTNNTGDGQNLMIYFDDQAGPWHLPSLNVEEKLRVRIQKPDSTFSIMPNGTDEEVLKDLYDYNQAFVFDSLSGGIGNSKSYKILITFDVNAGNEYQNKKTVFDLAVGIDAVPNEDDEDDNEDEDGNDGDGNNDGGGGNALLSLFSPSTPALLGGQGEEVQGVTTPEEGGGIGEGPGLAGAEKICHYWPLWVWVLAFAVFILNFWRNARKNYKEEKYRWIFPFIWTFIAVAFWYFFDKCREYKWFLYLSMIGAILSHFIYLYMLKRKVKKSLDKIEKKD